MVCFFLLSIAVSKSSYIGNPSPAPPSDVNFYSVEMESGRFMGYEPNPSPVPCSVVGVPPPGASTMLEGPGPGYYPSLGPASGHHHPLQQQQPHNHNHHHGSTSLLMGVGSLVGTTPWSDQFCPAHLIQC